MIKNVYSSYVRKYKEDVAVYIEKKEKGSIIVAANRQFNLPIRMYLVKLHTKIRFYLLTIFTCTF